MFVWKRKLEQQALRYLPSLSVIKMSYVQTGLGVDHKRTWDHSAYWSEFWKSNFPSSTSILTNFCWKTNSSGNFTKITSSVHLLWQQLVNNYGWNRHRAIWVQVEVTEQTENLSWGFMKPIKKVQESLLRKWTLMSVGDTVCKSQSLCRCTHNA